MLLKCTAVAYHSRDGEILLQHLSCQPVHFPSCIQENHSLGDCKRLVQVT